METLPFDPIELIACDRHRNIRRRYRIAACRDLFGHILIETQWGRIGARGNCLVRSFGQESDALRYVRAVLARRATAPSRIGVAYRCITPGDNAIYTQSSKTRALRDASSRPYGRQPIDHL
jgi:predicted DNA-binding WGR domain protein